MKINPIASAGLLFLVILVLILSVAAPTQAFTSPEGGFSIWMPADPTLQRVNHKSFVGIVKETSYILNTETERYGSSYTDLPGIALTFLSNKSLLNKAKKTFLKETGAREISFQMITYHGKTGIELAFQMLSENKSEPTVGKARFYLIGKKLYVLTVTTDKGPEGDFLVNRYLNSFELLSTLEKGLSLN